MLPSTIQKPDGTFARSAAMRGYAALYRHGQINHCPGCGRTQWYVGRVSAECGFCATALQLQDASARGDSAIRTRNSRPVSPQSVRD